MRLVLASLLLLGGSVAPPDAPPFRFVRDASMGRGVGAVETRPAGPLGDDPALPGYRFHLPMATFKVQRTRARLPERYVLAFVPGAHVALEHLSVAGPGGRVETFLGADEETVTDAAGRTRRVAAGTYATLRVVRGEVRAELHRPALALLARGGTVAWVDVYRH